MNVKSSLLAVSACLLLLTPTFAQKPQKEAAPAPVPKTAGIEVSEKVVKVADWAGFKYREVLTTSMTGDVQSIKKFLEFSGTVDGVDALNHAVTCLELIRVASDSSFSLGCLSVKPALKKVLLERLTLAQARTKKIELRDAMVHWAPSTWAVLNGGEPICKCEHNSTTDTGAPRKASSPEEAARPSFRPGGNK